jgi:hypothetical protein
MSHAKAEVTDPLPTISTPEEATKMFEPPRTRLDFSALADAAGPDKAEILQKLADVTRVLIGRSSEALKIYEPLPTQEAFHRSRCRVRLARGSNRSGKTNCCAVEVARAVTRSDPYGKYNKTGNIYIVAEEWGEIGRVIYPKLFETNAFKVIRDKTTGEMRSYKPWLADDLARKDQAKAADPLIPKRFISKIEWYDEGRRQPSIITLKTGWVIEFFSSKSKPPSGTAIDLAWLDEEIPKAEWFIELNSRVVEREGRIIWSATPEIGTDQFYDYSQKAEEQIQLPEDSRDFEEYKMTLADNPHMTEKAKRDMASALDDQELQIRVYGEFANVGRFVWPEYSRRDHCIDIPLERIKNWTHYASFDPGYQIGACLVASVPDPVEVVDPDLMPEPFDLIVWDELYIPKCAARDMAREFHDKFGHLVFEDWVIDMHGARPHSMGDGMTTIAHYRDEFRKIGLSNRRRGVAFAHGNDDVDGAVSQVREMLKEHRMTGYPRVRFLGKKTETGTWKPACKHFDSEITHWKNKVIDGLATDKPETKGRVHLMACMRYMAGLRPVFVQPDYGDFKPGSPLAFLAALERKTARQFGSSPAGSLNFGPAGS